MRTVFILVPAPRPTGPVKGAYALANALAPARPVRLVFLKPGPGVDAPLDPRVQVISLAQAPGGWRGRLAAYRDLLRGAGGRQQVGSISMCLSADWLNRFCRAEAVTCASVRGNLPQNYRHDYGWTGSFLAIAHLLALRAFDHVVGMTEAMARQIRSIAAVRPRVIGNFVDEAALDPYRRPAPGDGPLRFVFVGSLGPRKQPELVVRAMEALAGHDVRLDVIGDGPLRQAIEASLPARGLQDRVRFHGQLADPYPLVAAADAFVLPSRSEGVSRAALEALHLGVPCVLRDVDGNGELLADPAAGTLFMREDELANAMIQTATRSRTRASRASLLPDAFRQATAATQYLALLEGTA
ncbi:glycosyltransferase [Ramlibacter sp.]|uniref:glycosyltransferase n=1 Tax=Ramlibacter sp. TaxID=1917967 RepID=UPI002D432076|nr:glycosyltransferase [Ramlibacter sp.]HYD75010.1 glycosyltransferase [Ramlibacter sp.]